MTGWEDDWLKVGRMLRPGVVSPMRILIVEDQPESAAALCRVLRSAGFDVTCVTTAAAALRACLTQSIALLVCHSEGPRPDGWSFVREIRDNCSVPAIAVVDPDHPDLAKFQDAGFSMQFRHAAVATEIVRAIREFPQLHSDAAHRCTRGP